MINCFQLCFNFASKFNLRRYSTGILPYLLPLLVIIMAVAAKYLTA